jgi:hypothetical protein
MHFWAKAKSPSVSLTILVGGMNAADGGKACASDTDCASLKCVSNACTEPHHDTLNLSTNEQLGPGWQTFDIVFQSGTSYGPEVMSGFGWTAVMPLSQKTIEFYVDDLRWE